MSDNGWRNVRLGDFVTLQRGHDLPDRERRLGLVPILGSFGVTGYHDKPRAAGPGVTVGRSGASFGVVSYSAIPFWPLNTALYVRDFHGNDELFAYYFLRCIDFKRYNSGSAQPSLNRNFIHPIEVTVPPLSEQRSIASILGALDDKIELNRKMSSTLEAIARALFKSWFVDFDPVRAKAEGRDPGLPPEIAALFPDSFEESELGEIPSGWSLKPVADIASASRTMVNPLTSLNEVFDHYSIPAYDSSRGAIVERGAAIKSNKFLVLPDAVLLSRLNPRTPRVWMPASIGLQRAICSTEFAVMLPKVYSREWLYCLFSNQVFCDRFTTMVTGTSGSHQRVSPESLLAMPVIAPAENVVEIFSRSVGSLLTRAAFGRTGSRTLAALRDALLPKLIAGEIRVTDAERVLTASA